MLSLSLRNSSRIFSPASAFSSSFSSFSSFSSLSSFSRLPSPSSSLSPPLSPPSSLLFHPTSSRKSSQTNPQDREERDHPRFDFHGTQTQTHGPPSKDLVQQLINLEERVADLVRENDQLKEKIRSYNPSKYATRPGSQYANSSHLSWVTGFKRNGPLNLFYIHHPLTNEIPLNSKTDTHIAAWVTLGVITLIQAGILYSWTHCAFSFDEHVKKLADPANEDLKDEIVEDVLAAVGDITFMEDNFMTSNTNVQKHGRYWTLLTACFSHSNLSHFLGNLVAMWLFGFKLLRVIGPARFLALYSAGGVFASFCQNEFSAWRGGVEELPPFAERCRSNFDWESIKDPKYDTPSLGASGSVLAMAGAASLFFPKDMVIVRFVPFPLPFPIAAGIYFVSDLLGITHPDFLRKLTQGENIEGNYSPTVGHAAHVGGILFGFLFSLLLLRKRKLPIHQPHHHKT